jgi:hypothetical protein
MVRATAAAPKPATNDGYTTNQVGDPPSWAKCRQLWMVFDGGPHLPAKLLTAGQIRRRVAAGKIPPDVRVRIEGEDRKPVPLVDVVELLDAGCVEAAMARLVELLETMRTPAEASALRAQLTLWLRVLPARSDLSQFHGHFLQGLLYESSSPLQAERCYLVALAESPAPCRAALNTHLARLYLVGEVADLDRGFSHLIKARQIVPSGRTMPTANLQTGILALEAVGITSLVIEGRSVTTASLRQTCPADYPAFLEQATMAERSRKPLERIPPLMFQQLVERFAAHPGDPVERQRKLRAAQLAGEARHHEREGCFDRAAAMLTDAGALDAAFRPAAESSARQCAERAELADSVARQEALRSLKDRFDEKLREKDYAEAAPLLAELAEGCAGCPGQTAEVTRREAAIRRARAADELLEARRRGSTRPEALQHALANPSTAAEAKSFLHAAKAEELRMAVRAACASEDPEVALQHIRCLESLGPPYDREAASLRSGSIQLAEVKTLREAGIAAVQGDSDALEKKLRDIPPVDPEGRLDQKVRRQAEALANELQRVQLRQAKADLLAALNAGDLRAASDAVDRLRSLGGAGQCIPIEYAPWLEAIERRWQARNSSETSLRQRALLQQAHWRLSEWDPSRAETLACEWLAAEHGSENKALVERLLSDPVWRRIQAGSGTREDHRWLQHQLAPKTVVPTRRGRWRTFFEKVWPRRSKQE